MMASAALSAGRMASMSSAHTQTSARYSNLFSYYLTRLSHCALQQQHLTVRYLLNWRVCWSCDYALGAGAKFCPNCGSLAR